MMKSRYTNEKAIFAQAGLTVQPEDLLIRVHVTNRYHPSYKKVLTMGVERYLTYVLPGLFRRHLSLDVCKALSVLCRSQAYRQCMSPLPYDVDDRHDLPYRPELPLTGAMQQALRETEGLVLTFAGRPIDAVFGLCNGGVQRSAKERWGSEVPYLPHRRDPFDHSHTTIGGGVGLSLLGLEEALQQGYAWQDVLLRTFPHTKLEKDVRFFHCPTICRGAKGVKVVLLQQLLRAQGETVPTNGVFDGPTVQGVKHFRMRHGLRFSAIADGFFWDALLAADQQRRTRLADERQKGVSACSTVK